jgi:hypothetical protein
MSKVLTQKKRVSERKSRERLTIDGPAIGTPDIRPLTYPRTIVSLCSEPLIEQCGPAGFDVYYNVDGIVHRASFTNLTLAKEFASLKFADDRKELLYRHKRPSKALNKTELAAVESRINVRVERWRAFVLFVKREGVPPSDAKTLCNDPFEMVFLVRQADKFARIAQELPAKRERLKSIPPAKTGPSADRRRHLLFAVDQLEFAERTLSEMRQTHPYLFF